METLIEREITYAEEKAIATALLEHRSAEGNDFVHLGDLETTMNSLRCMAKNLQVVKFYDETKFIGILVFDVVKIWWSKKRFLDEVLILCVSSTYHGFARVAIKYLNHLAKVVEADAILAGCYFQTHPMIVTNSYMKDGFDIYVPNFIKVIKHDI